MNRPQWREPQRPRHLHVDDFDPLAVRIGRFLMLRPWLFVAAGLLCGGYFLARILWNAALLVFE